MSTTIPYDLSTESDLRQFSNFYASNFMVTNNGSDELSNGHGRKEQITEMQQIVEASMPDSSKKGVYQILEKIEELKPAEKLLLYLRLPTGSPDTDPLKQPQNPLGTRLEINHTINWVRSHLEIDPNVSIPKQDVYDDYLSTFKPLSTADFGKVMKQVFPSIRPRRLGTRGNSRYCYAALRKTTQLAPPSLPELKAHAEVVNDADDDETTVSKFVKNTIKVWASNLLSSKFERLDDLASYITTNNMNSLSAKVLQRKITRDAKLSHKKNESLTSKRRRRKRRITSQSQAAETAASTTTSGNSEIVEKFAKKNAPIEPILLGSIKTEIDIDSGEFGTKTTLNETKVYCDKNFDTDTPQYPSTIVSNIQKEPVKNVIMAAQDTSMKPPFDRSRMPLDGMVNGAAPIDSNLSLKRLLNTSTNPPTRPNFVFREPNNVETSQQQQQQQQQQPQQQVQQLPENADESSDLIIPRERVISICTLDKDALDSYLIEGENSQDQEAELMEYFQSEEANNVPTAGKKQTTPILENYQLYNNDLKVNRKISFDDNNKQIFELRSYLQQNFDSTKNLAKKKPGNPLNTHLKYTTAPTTVQRNAKSKRGSKSSTKSQSFVQSNFVQNANARCQKYSFVPISPGPQSPVQSRAFNFNNNNTITSSPFVSPGITPKPRQLQNYSYTPSHSVDQFELNGTFSKPFQLKEEISASAPTSPQSLKANAFQFFPEKNQFFGNDRFSMAYQSNATVSASLCENRSQSVPVDRLFPQKYNHYSSTSQTPIPPDYIDFGNHDHYFGTVSNHLIDNKNIKPLRFNAPNHVNELAGDLNFQFKHHINPTSRSVPSTPQPCHQRYQYRDVEISSFKPFDMSKSVPTTPITTCPFRYSPELNRDFLINGNTVDLDSLGPLYKDTSNSGLCDDGLAISDEIEELSSFDNVADPIIGSDLLSNI
ncbi:hypothetical protein HA402_005825 [Bradysia odoriphaga]|nr:hypothetical protein HA402_005825 [Bradysia odoriphaga]